MRDLNVRFVLFFLCMLKALIMQRKIHVRTATYEKVCLLKEITVLVGPAVNIVII